MPATRTSQRGVTKDTMYLKDSVQGKGVDDRRVTVEVTVDPGVTIPERLQTQGKSRMTHTNRHSISRHPA